MHSNWRGRGFAWRDGAGFIGFAVCRHLCSSTGHWVGNIDKLTYVGNLASRRAVENYVKRIADNLREYHIDIVMHRAAESHVDR